MVRDIWQCCPALLSTAPPRSFTATAPAVMPPCANFSNLGSTVESLPASASTSAELGVLLSRKHLLPCPPPSALATAPSLPVAGHLSHAAELDSSQLSPRLASLAQIEVVLCTGFRKDATEDLEDVHLRLVRSLRKLGLGWSWWSSLSQ